MPCKVVIELSRKIRAGVCNTHTFAGVISATFCMTRECFGVATNAKRSTFARDNDGANVFIGIEGCHGQFVLGMHATSPCVGTVWTVKRNGCNMTVYGNKNGGVAHLGSRPQMA